MVGAHDTQLHLRHDVGAQGVVHCHRAIFLATLDSLVEWAVPPRPTYLWTLPMFHTNGWSC